MGGCFVQTAAGRRCSSRLRRWIPYMITMGFEPMTSLARTRPLLKQRGERPAHLPDPICARPAPGMHRDWALDSGPNSTRARDCSSSTRSVDGWC